MWGRNKGIEMGEERSRAKNKERKNKQNSKVSLVQI